MAKKIEINGCIGCSICTTICPELFSMSDDRQAFNLYGNDSEVPEDLELSLNEAIDACPVSAIHIKD